MIDTAPLSTIGKADRSPSTRPVTSEMAPWRMAGAALTSVFTMPVTIDMMASTTWGISSGSAWAMFSITPSSASKAAPLISRRVPTISTALSRRNWNPLDTMSRMALVAELKTSGSRDSRKASIAPEVLPHLGRHRERHPGAGPIWLAGCSTGPWSLRSVEDLLKVENPTAARPRSGEREDHVVPRARW